METAYKAWTLRFVPDSVRGEFINIGLIVGCNYADWSIRTVESFSRANRIGGEAQLLNPFLRALKSSVEITNNSAASEPFSLPLWNLEQGITEGYLDDLRRRLNNSLQISEPHLAHGSNAQQILDLLYPHFVSENLREPMHRARTQMRHSFREALRGLWRDDEVPLVVDPVVHSGGERHEFDFALHSSNVEQMTQVISLNRKDPNAVRRDIRAWNYGVTSLRERGASLELPTDGSLFVPRDVDISVIYDEPQNAVQATLLAESQRGWQHMGVKDFSRSEMENAAQQAASSLLAAS